MVPHVPHVMCHVSVNVRTLSSLSGSSWANYRQLSKNITTHTINAMIVLVVNVCCMALSLLMDDEQRGWDPQHAIFECLYHET